MLIKPRGGVIDRSIFGPFRPLRRTKPAAVTILVDSVKRGPGNPAQANRKQDACVGVGLRPTSTTQSRSTGSARSAIDTLPGLSA
jgi:hypothetical protein